MGAVRRKPVAFNPFHPDTHGTLHRSQRQSQPPIRHAAIRPLQIPRTKGIPARHARSEEKPASRRLAAKNLELTQIAPVPDWLTANKDAFTGTVNRIPTREEIQPIVNEQLIVELYSKA